LSLRNSLVLTLPFCLSLHFYNTQGKKRGEGRRKERKRRGEGRSGSGSAGDVTDISSIILQAVFLTNYCVNYGAIAVFPFSFE
jgi:hypothetical protein